jgi:glutamate-5-semialdehyde dehydrogenase
LHQNGVVLYGDTESRKLSPKIKRATVEDWKAEYLDLRLAEKTAKNIDDAIEHINKYGSHHTERLSPVQKRRLRCLSGR